MHLQRARTTIAGKTPRQGMYQSRRKINPPGVYGNAATNDFEISK